MGRVSEHGGQEAEPAASPARADTLAGPLTLRQIASATGNRGFGVVARQLARTAAEASAVDAGTWAAPLGLGAVSTAAGARGALDEIWIEATRLHEAGFEDFAEVALEADLWWNEIAVDSERALTSDEAAELTRFGNEFAPAHRDAVRALADTVKQQLRIWKAPPIVYEDVYAIREAVHALFMSQPDSDEIQQLTELLGKVEEVTGEFTKWSDRAATAEKYLTSAKKIGELNEGVKKLTDPLGEAKKILELTRNIAELTGVAGEGDKIAEFEAALGVVDFGLGKAGVPVLSMFWDGYVLQGAKDALVGIKKMRSLNREFQRPEVVDYFNKHRDAAFPPNIDKVQFLMESEGDREYHLPGGRETLQYMWQLMRNESFVDQAPFDIVPTELEDLLLKHRDLFNKGATGELKVESDWDPFTRDTSPNLKAWVKKNRHRVWTMLYGGIKKPRKATKLVPD